MTISNLTSPIRFHHLKSKLNVQFSELVRDLTSTEIAVVGNYDLLETIGKGAYGKVKLGMHRLTGQKVAIKIVDKTHAHTAAREIETWRHLHHPNITQLLEILTTETKIYMVMEHVTGGELFDHITTHGALNEHCGKSMFRKLTLAVDYIHRKKCVHRDLKLENILLDKDLNPKIIDFGFTRGIQSRKLLDTYCGSLAYVAPEVIAGTQYSGQETDVWSLGVILYTVVCGYLPFDDEDESIMQRLIVDANFTFPEGLSKECQDLISGILKKNPADRLTVEEILNHPWVNETEASMDYEMAAPNEHLTTQAGPGEHSSSDPTQNHSPTKAPLAVDCRSAIIQSATELRLCSLLSSIGMRAEMMKKSVQENLCDSLSALYYLLLKKNHEALGEEKFDPGVPKRRSTNEEMDSLRHPKGLFKTNLLFKEPKNRETISKPKTPNGKRTNMQKLKSRAGIQEFKLPSPPFFKRFDFHFRKHRSSFSSDEPSRPAATITPPTSPNLLLRPITQTIPTFALKKPFIPSGPVIKVNPSISSEESRSHYRKSRNIRGLTVLSTSTHDEKLESSNLSRSVPERGTDRPTFRAIQATITEEEEEGV
ncbi:hypothetical protein K7432_009277 [Basidiobolus ranarum]|uniref:Protein kinase domain-containing protein n=1 Tax=Basidiobolus ranarum TaxID=34480 RepID=A0ABR2VXA2_9FUNG